MTETKMIILPSSGFLGHQIMDADHPQEHNLLYIALTRSTNRLTLLMNRRTQRVVSPEGALLKKKIIKSNALFLCISPLKWPIMPVNYGQTMNPEHIFFGPFSDVPKFAVYFQNQIANFH